ncbi:MAG TPA: triose-phosphate isomerase family protein [Sphaerochaeta sp.]|nr:triose-phosphate isomerase family protein [Sphaerochaeta sp.]
MKRYIFVNFKRFDIPAELGGVNRIAPVQAWASQLVRTLETGLAARTEGAEAYEYVLFFPEAHLLGASLAKDPAAPFPMQIGAQGVHHQDTSVGGNFGAFTTSLSANAAAALGARWVIIGHSEERAKYAQLLLSAGVSDDAAQRAIDSLLNKSVAAAVAANLRVLFCIGERAEEVEQTEAVLRRQIETGLKGIDDSQVVLAYEPLWAIGPGKTPPSAQAIGEITSRIKAIRPLPVVYGGGLKEENAQQIGAIQHLDGGLIALTRFSGEIGFYPDEYLEIVAHYQRGGTR